MTTREIQRGFTLLEVLITIAVLGISLLGLAGLQTSGIRYTYTSYLMAVATQQAEDMIERMRANPAEATKTGGYYDSIAGSASASIDCAAAHCDETERAEYDHDLWNDKNTELLGQNGTVRRVGDVFEVKLLWSEVDSAGSTQPRTYTVVFRP